MDIQKMTFSTLERYRRAGIPAECCLCELPVGEGEAYIGGGLMMTCVSCAVLRARRRVENAEIMLQVEQDELARLEAAMTAAPKLT